LAYQFARREDFFFVGEAAEVYVVAALGEFLGGVPFGFVGAEQEAVGDDDRARRDLSR
jgi:hypothetical protein